MKKTDNSNLLSKLFLRRYFLDKYPARSVFDCCQGSKAIWESLLKEYRVQYFGVDMKEKKGRLKIDSVKILQGSDWDFDVVDIDTYGSPWKHWAAALQNGPDRMTVFLTSGFVQMGGGVTLPVFCAASMGINREMYDSAPSAILGGLYHVSTPYMISLAEKYGYRIVEAIESPRSRKARYFGIRLEKTS